MVREAGLISIFLPPEPALPTRQKATFQSRHRVGRAWGVTGMDVEPLMEKQGRGLPWWSSSQDPTLPGQGAPNPSLAGELISHML